MESTEFRTQQVRVLETGLSLLYEPNSRAADVDIVFVHGLQGHPQRTWSHAGVDMNGNRSVRTRPSVFSFLKGRASQQTAPSRDVKNPQTQGTFWPLDLLPNDLPNARILTFGYDSHVTKLFGGTVNHGNILSHGRNLIYALGRARRDCRGRRLVFIAHSLGVKQGIIVKEVLRQSEHNEDSSVLDIYKSVVLVMFLGTPHRGSAYSNIADTVRSIVAAMGIDTNDKNIRALQFDSVELEISRQGFSRQFRNNDFAVKTFQEAYPLKGIRGFSGKVVPDFSSSLDDPRERAEHINSNHLDICRFADRLDEGYQQVKDELCLHLSNVAAGRKAQQELPEDLENQKENKRMETNMQTSLACLQSLSFPEMDTRKLDIVQYLSGTCAWLLKAPNYQNWIEHGKSELLWLKGKPGSGKSVLTKAAFVKSIGTDTLVSCISIAFFFTARGTSLQKSATGMLRSLIHQLLKQNPEVNSEIIRAYKEKVEVYKNDWEWHLEELKSLFISALLRVGKREVRIYIDALDECVEDSMRSLVRFIEHIVLSATTSDLDLKIFLSSRHFPNIQIMNCLEIVVEDYNEADIEKYVKTTLHHSLDPVTPALISDILKKASGIFLWAVLIADRLEEARDRGENANRMREIVHKIPEGLNELFRQNMQSLEPRDRLESLRIFQWVLFTTRPLQPSELRCALAFDVSDIPTSQVEILASPTSYQTDEQICKLVRARTIGLVEVTCIKGTRHEGAVQFIHESVREFLLEQDGFKLLGAMINENYILENHHRIAKTCLGYLSIKELADLPVTHTNPDSLDWTAAQEVYESLATTYPLLNYSVTTTLRHCKLSEPLRSTETLGEDILLDSFISCYKVWLYLFDLDMKRQNGMLQGLNTPLALIATEYNIVDWVSKLLGRGFDVNKIGGQKYETLLQTAAAMGHVALVQLLLASGANIHTVGGNHGTALHAAAFQGNISIVRVLLEKGCNVNLRAGEYFTVLQAASQCMQEGTEFIEMLLAAGADVNVQGGRHGSALQACAFCGNIAGVQLLLSYGAEVNSKGGEHGSALQAAAFKGHGMIVDILLERGCDVNIDVGNYGNALWAAALAGQENIVRKLLCYSAGVEGTFDENISLPSRDPKLEELVYKMLSDAANSQWLYEAVEKADTDTVLRLIDSGVNVNLRCGALSSVWHVGAYFGRFEILRHLLLQPNPKPDMVDSNGRTPLWHAAGNGDIDTVRLLSNSGLVQYDTKSFTGRNLLWWACYRGHVEVVEIMLAKGVNPYEIDEEGHSCFWAAKTQGHTIILALFQKVL